MKHIIYHSINDLPASWDTLPPTNDLFLKSHFLKGLEQGLPENITMYYVGVFKGEILVGIAIIQRVELYVKDIFRRATDNTLKQQLKWMVSTLISGNVLVVGNLMHTGQHSLYFNPSKTNAQAFLNTINQAVETLKTHIKHHYKKHIRIIAFKDYFETDAMYTHKTCFEAKGYYDVQVQPNMILKLNSEWQTIEDYVFALQKKYKRRYKTARKKALPINKRVLDLAEVKTEQHNLFKLYETVSDNAKVNAFKLPEHHFYTMKKQLGSHFKVIGYYLDNELIGFYSLILNNEHLETYFLGYNKALQNQYQLYLNMLYDMLDYAIIHKFKAVIYARTALEIKSSVGAKPYPMHIFIKHTNTFLSKAILKPIVTYMNPIRQWQERHPFK